MIIGYTTRVFDLFHVGHLNILERCKEHCDELIVGVCTDEYTLNTKGKLPIISYEDRTRIISSLKCVDCVVPMNETDKLVAWNNLHFNVLFSGDDWKDTERYQKTEMQFKPLGVDIIYFPYTRGVSTTEILRKITSVYNPDVNL